MIISLVWELVALVAHLSLVGNKTAPRDNQQVCLKLKWNKMEPTTFALTIALPSIDGIAVVTRHAALTVRPRRQVSTVFAYAAVDAPAVAVTLTRCQKTTHTINEYLNTYTEL